jgi:hypothetical protein
MPETNAPARGGRGTGTAPRGASACVPRRPDR